MITKLNINPDLIRELSRLLDETGLNEIEYEARGRRIRVRRDGGGAPVSTVVLPHSSGESAAQGDHAQLDNTPNPQPDHPGAVVSQMVGTAYMAPEPGAPPYVQVGDSVREGQILMIVEAMKTMNPVLASQPGTVARILVSDGAPIEYGEVLMVIE